MKSQPCEVQVEGNTIRQSYRLLSVNNMYGVDVS